MPTPVIHLVCGLNGSGKSTLARKLADEGRVRLSLDEHMIARYPGLRYDDPEYARAVGAAIEELWAAADEHLRGGRDVVLDWNQWSRERRADARLRATRLGAEIVLHWVDVPVETAVRRARTRDDPGSHRLDEPGVRHLATIFEDPDPTEGIAIIRHHEDEAAE
jgi:predicted kinase